MTTCNHITHDRQTTDPHTQTHTHTAAGNDRPNSIFLNDKLNRSLAGWLHEICNSIPLCLQFAISLLAQMSLHCLSRHLLSYSDLRIQTWTEFIKHTCGWI